MRRCHTFRQIIVWHADEKEPRVHIDQVAHRFHMFLQISQHVLRVGPHPLGVFLHSRYERCRTSYRFVVPCSNKTCSLMLRQRSGLLWTRPWCRLRCHRLCLGPIIFVVLGCALCTTSSTLSGCLGSSGLVEQAGFSAEVDFAELWPSVVNRFHACSKVWLCYFRTCKNVSSLRITSK